ncbi:hypothetical protein BGZ99_003618 [Dissophora globulifera]|uniref:Mediator of RNA polymerase II transcription subunit 9 n=1 Tax=Dissophora globulifera TaxID=979702 RepID=A0A9P6UW30_9FUNG|nr:hypothetical protein BGZ99_003618 [Dissophora globulifera]
MSGSLTSSLTSITDTREQEQTFQPSDFSFLPQLLVILQKLEAGDDAQELATLASNLKTSFKKCQTILDHLPGADLSPDEQARILAEEIQVLEKKKAQLATYLSWQVFQHETLDGAIQQDQSNDHIAQGSASASTNEHGGSFAEDREDVRIKNEHLEQTPSLATDISFLSDSSQGFTQPSSLQTGLTLDFADVKMEDTQDMSM